MANDGTGGDPQNPVQSPKMRPARSPFTTQREIEKEIEAGLPNQIGRMRDAYDCQRYAMARFEEYPTRHKDMRYRSPSVRRTSPIMRRIVDILTMHLYKNQPTRKVRDKAVSAWLETVYRRNRMWAKWRRADQLALIGGFAAFQFAGSEDPAAPIDINLWGADQLAFWVRDGCPTEVQAVATVDFSDNQRRLTLWTQEQIVTYETTKGMIHPGFGSTTFRLAGADGKAARRANPYRDKDGRGVIPFSFAHWCFPCTDFETNSPGLNLKELNQGVNERLDNLGDSIYFNCKPIGVAEGVADGWTPPAELRPGDFLKLPADEDLGGNGVPPTLRYLMPDLAYVSKDWEDQAAFLDHTLEMWGVPPSLIRMVQTGARSGASLVAEQLPILGWVEGRRSDWASYEEDAAEMALMVAASHLLANGFEEDAQALLATLDDWSFSLRWPQLYIQLPGPERDRSDDWRLQHSHISLVGLLQERQDLTEDEAFEHMKKVAEQNARLQAMGINPMNAAPGLGLGGPLGPAGLPPSDGDDGGQGLLPPLADPGESRGPDIGVNGDQSEQTDMALEGIGGG